MQAADIGGKLKHFIDLCKSDPSVVHNPSLGFFRSYIESLGALIPPASEPSAIAEIPHDEVEDHIVESDIELDEIDVVEPDNDPPQKMGDPSVDVSEENQDAAQKLKLKAVVALYQGQLDEAISHLTEAIMLNPRSAILYTTRGGAFVKLKKPNAAIRDADAALQINPDSAKAYKVRGMAKALVGEWEEAANDLRVASKSDYDEDIDSVLGKVESNALKIEMHRIKYELLRKTRELKKIELEKQRQRSEDQVRDLLRLEAQGGDACIIEASKLRRAPDKRVRGKRSSCSRPSSFLEQNPGPDDTSVLRLQDQHRSEDIGHNIDNDELRIRQHHLLPLHPRVRPYIIRSGFIGLTQIGHIQIDTNLILALLERWRRETHTFHLRVGEMTPTLQDVAVLLGLPIDGPAVTSANNFDPHYVCLSQLGATPPPSRLKGGSISMQWLREQFEHGPPNDATVEVLLNHARGYILHLIGSVLFTNNTGNWTSLIFLTLFDTMEQCRLYSWGSAVLAYLYRQLCRACMKGAKQLGGCVMLLQLWSWEHLQVGRPVIASPREHEVIHNDLPPPLGARWNAHLTYRDSPRSSLSFYRDQLDVQQAHQVVWLPYVNRFNTLPRICLEGQYLWRYVGPLISFDIVEMHCVDRVLRQFGLIQHIPDLVDTFDSLHRTNRRGRSDENWQVYHAKWIEIWNSRENHIVGERIPQISIDEYMQWYLAITRLVITRRELHVSRRARLHYEPSGNRLQEVVNIVLDQTRRAGRALHQIFDHTVESMLMDWLTSCSNILDVVGEGHQFRQVLLEEGIVQNISSDVRGDGDARTQQNRFLVQRDRTISSAECGEPTRRSRS